MFKYFSFTILLCYFSANSQIHEIGLFVGGNNFVGDVGSTTYIAPNQLALGILYKWNRTPRLSYRFAINSYKYEAQDSKSKEISRNEREFQFKNSIKELSLGLEFNFFEFNLHEIDKKLTPYVHLGLNYLLYKDSYLDSNIEVLQKNSGTFAIPMTVGIKSNVLPHFVLAMEIGARYTFTDNLDGSNPKQDSFPKFGNINNNDWVIVTGFSLTYTFGDKPCYCPE